MRPLSRSISFGALILAAAGVASIGCDNNPVADLQIDALGPEAPGVPESEYHRPGQPCVLCHGPNDEASPQMAIGGTIFARPKVGDAAGIPVPGAQVKITDSFGSTRVAVTNCMGNFWIPQDDWDPGYPLAAEVACPPPGSTRLMDSRIGRDGSCARCHDGARNQGSPGWVVCDATYAEPTKETCPGGVP